MITLRTERTEARYRAFLQQNKDSHCYLCRAQIIREFKHWKIVKNEYPYDKIAAVNHIIASKRHCNEERLTKIEKEEWIMLKNSMINECYDTILENTHNKKSIPGHYHLQLIELKLAEIETRAWPVLPDVDKNEASTRALETVRAL